MQWGKHYRLSGGKGYPEVGDLYVFTGADTEKKGWPTYSKPTTEKQE